MAKPGRYLFRCSEYPWSTGELIVGESGVNPQVRRGELLYQENCAVCHRNDLGGQEPAPQLAGLGFRAKWAARTIGDLYELVRTTMPPNRPGALPDQQYIDLLTFLLDSNDIPPSSKELTPSSKELVTQQIESGQGRSAQ